MFSTIEDKTRKPNGGKGATQGRIILCGRCFGRGPVVNRVDTLGNERLSSKRIRIPLFRPFSRITEDQSVGQPLEAHIRKLQEFYWSERDPVGRGFVPLADALRKAGDFVESQRVLREGLSRHPDFISGHVVAGWLSLDRGRLEEAEARFRTALELDPKNIAALRALGDILMERGDGGAALDILEVLSYEDPMDLDLPGLIADLRLQAESAVEEIPDPDEEPVPPVWDDPHSVADELDWGSATLQPDESPEDKPGGDPDEEAGEGAVVTSTLGEIYLRQGLLDEAEDVFETLLKDDPQSALLRQRLEEVRSLKRGGEVLGDRAGRFPGEEEESFDYETSREAGPEDSFHQAEFNSSRVVPIESLAPDRISTRAREDLASPEESAPDEPISVDALAPDEPISVEALAPDEPISVEALAPDEPISIEALAPDEPISIEALAPDEPISIEALAPDEPISIEALAPDEPISIEALALDEPISIDALAPDEPVSVAALAPDESQSNPKAGAFEIWLEGLK
jgi:tetratricopeptide (TPR) repeat protein